MYLLLIGLIVLAALLMCFVVLIQNSKGGGLASSFASSNQIMGVRKTTDFIEKLTWGLAAFMVAGSVLTAYFVPAAHTDSSVIMEEAVKEAMLANHFEILEINHMKDWVSITAKKA